MLRERERFPTTIPVSPTFFSRERESRSDPYLKSNGLDNSKIPRENHMAFVTMLVGFVI